MKSITCLPEKAREQWKRIDKAYRHKVERKLVRVERLYRLYRYINDAYILIETYMQQVS